MSRLVKIVNNKYVQIEEYKNPNICFNTNEYDNFEDYCTLRETFDPFEIFYENQELKKQLENKYEKVGALTRELLYEENTKLIIQQKEFISYLENEIYSIEPKGTGINYNCEYDSEEDYISAMKEQSKLNTLKEILSKYKSIIEEDKKIEKLEIEKDENTQNYFIRNEYGTKCYLTKHSKIIASKINELIVEINNLKED